MKTIAIVGAGPTGIYTLFSLLQQQTPLSISIFEQADEAGVGMPYSDEENSKLVLANIASIEIPPIYCTCPVAITAKSNVSLGKSRFVASMTPAFVICRSVTWHDS